MKHSIEELYKVQGSAKLLTKEASEIITKIPTHRALYQTHKGNTVTVYDVDGTKTIYMFGEKTWFDTQEELDEYRARYHAEQEVKRNNNKIKNAILAELNTMTTEQLYEVCNMLGVVI